MKKCISFVLLMSLLFLCGCTGAEEHAWQSGQKALVEEKFSEAAAAFEKAGTYEHAEQLLQYAKAWSSLESEAFDEAESEFRALGDFKDSVLMVSYTQARKKQANAETGYLSDSEEAAAADRDAFVLYSSLSFFRDSDERAQYCRDRLYSKATEWMSSSRYEAAAAAFEALGSWQDSGELQKYCMASFHLEQGNYIDAAELFSEIPAFLDSDIRVNAALGQAYQHAGELKSAGNYEKAAEAFAALGSFRDAQTQRDDALSLLVKTLLQDGAYSEALQKYDLLGDPVVFPPADSDTAANLDSFLDAFLNTWLTAHAHVMNAYFSSNLLQPYLKSGGELDSLLREELSDDSAPLNYGFIYLGKEVKEAHVLDEGFTAVNAIGFASYISSEGPNEVEEPLLILVDTSSGNPLAAAVLPS